MQKEYTNLLKSPQPLESQNNINIELKSSNNHNDSAKNIQNLYGPGRIRTNDPRHVKAVS